jgi:hypothetical protein
LLFINSYINDNYESSPIAGWCLFVLLTVNKEIRQRKNKKKTKKTGHGVCW